MVHMFKRLRADRHPIVVVQLSATLVDHILLYANYEADKIFFGAHARRNFKNRSVDFLRLSDKMIVPIQSKTVP